jgi:MbtH protein
MNRKFTKSVLAGFAPTFLALITAFGIMASNGTIAYGQSDESEDTTVYQVVMNHEERYSIWSVNKEIPAGWKYAGKTGTKHECLDYIEEVWKDMRPLSLRRAMERIEREEGMDKRPPSPSKKMARTPSPSKKMARTEESKKDPESVLTKDQAAALVKESKEKISDLDDKTLKAITDKWSAQKLLEGKTKTQILQILFTEVRFVVRDKESQDKIWAALNDSETDK